MVGLVAATAVETMNAHRAAAAELARRISAHHRECAACQRGGTVGYSPVARRVVRVRCAAERALFAALEREQVAGWPR